MSHVKIVIYLKFKFNWASYILSANPTTNSFTVIFQYMLSSREPWSLMEDNKLLKFLLVSKDESSWEVRK